MLVQVRQLKAQADDMVMQSLISDESGQTIEKQVYAEVMDVLNLMRVNQNKIKEEANLKVECLI